MAYQLYINDFATRYQVVNQSSSRWTAQTLGVPKEAGKLCGLPGALCRSIYQASTYRHPSHDLVCHRQDRMNRGRRYRDCIARTRILVSNRLPLYR